MNIIFSYTSAIYVHVLNKQKIWCHKLVGQGDIDYVISLSWDINL